MRKLRILIVDDHAIVRAGIRSLLEGQPDIEVVGEAGRGDEAIEEALQLRPELVLLDIAMPGMNGIEVTRRLKKELPDLRILILTMHDDDEFFFPLLRAGASGYILKDTDPQQLLYAIRVVVDGQPFLSPTMAKALMESYVALATDLEGEKNGVLTSREREVLQLAAAGRTNREIAETLYLSVRTVEKHRQAMMRKLGLSSRDNLMKYAIRRGLIDIEDSPE
ncbi:MAG: response regulator transcription factor [Anaerolineae bacterium]